MTTQFPEIPYNDIEHLDRLIDHTTNFLLELKKARELVTIVPSKEESSNIAPPWEDGTTDPFEDVVEGASIELKGDQPAAYERIQSWLKSPTAPSIFGLLGVAGSGKSTLVKHLYASLSPIHEVYLCASTNDAAKNLAHILGLSTGSVPTFHSLFGLKASQEGEELSFDALSGRFRPSNSFKTLIIIDEIGTLPSSVLTLGLESIGSRIKVLGTGDPFQLPPVKEGVAKVFKMCSANESFAMLKTVLRFGDSKLDMATHVRGLIKSKEYDSLDLESYSNPEDGAIVMHESRRSFYLSIHQAMDEKGVEVFRDSKVLAFRNRTVDAYNRTIRERLGFTGVYSIGELCLLAEPVLDKGSVIAAVGSKVAVTSVCSSLVTLQTYNYNHMISVDCWCLSVSGDYNGTLRVPKYIEELNAYLSKTANVAKGIQDRRERKLAWADFWQAKNYFHSLRYSYAITVHRSQGSTLTNAWVDTQDILSMPDSISRSTPLKCLYVALTRAKTTLHII
jgi:energy-coupling factor transporter ATP-binding protein EcfA2